MKPFLCTLAIIGLAVVAAFGFDDQKRAAPAATETGRKDAANAEPNKWMKAKQKHAQSIFAGLTEGDFDRIEKSAGQMYGSGLMEKWMGDREFSGHYAYEGQSNAFEYSLKELRRHAKQRDINGTLNAYVMMSQSCVRCHSLVRDTEK